MSRHIILWFVLSGLVIGGAANAEESPQPSAWYRSEGLQGRGPLVQSWDNAVSTAPEKSLNRIFGKPQLVRVKTPGGNRLVLRLDGQSAVWQTAGQWGSLTGDRTLVCLIKLAPEASGFLFDGSTSTGLTRVQVRADQWQMGVQLPPIQNSDNADASTLESVPEQWQIHTFVFRRTDAGTKVIHYCGEQSQGVDIAATHPLSGFILGTNGATRLGLECDVAEVRVFDQALTESQIAVITADIQETWGTPEELPRAQQPQAETIPSDPRLFRTSLCRNGEGGVHTYRIPGLATSPAGTLIAVFDVRYKNGADLPGDIDVGMKRSTDHGETWSPLQQIMDFDDQVPGSMGNGVGDPAILVDHRTGTLFVAALWSFGNRAWHGSGPGTMPEETGQLVISRSTDDGLTWTRPVSLTSQVKKPGWHLCFQGPGNGIQLRDGTLVFPAQFRDEQKVAHSCFISSVDAGQTWSISPAAVPVSPSTSESAIAELSDGSLLLSMRDESRSGDRVWARWNWQGNLQNGSWSEPWLNVTDPTCMASLIRHPQGLLLFSNPDNAQRRDHLTVRVSRDDGQTWSAGQLLDPGPIMYSSLTVLRDGRVGIVYESAAGLEFVRFPLDWALE